MGSYISSLQIIISILILAFTSMATAKNNNARRSNTVLFQIKDSADSSKLDKLDKKLLQYQFKVERKLLNGKVKQVKATGNLKKLSEEELAAEIMSTGAVEFAEPDYLIAPSLLPNDPSFSNQWHHKTIRSSEAWDLTTGHNSIRAVVCDTGVYKDHPDLKGNLILPGYNSVDGSQNTDPIHGHGTLVAGTIGAIGNNSLGVAGVNWNIDILIGKISNTSDGYAYYSDMTECITWGADNGAKVANLSYLAGGSSSISSAGQYIRNKGGLLLVAAGNDGQNVTYSDFSSFLLVAATTSSDTKASWSNYGVAVDISAPGVSILTTNMSGGYSNASGTSFATPVTAGVVGLIYSINPSFTPDQVEGFLFASAKDIGEVGEDDVFGHGRVDAAGAVILAKNAAGNATPVARITVDKVTGEAPLTVQLSALDSFDVDGTIQSYSWNFADGNSGVGSEVIHTFSNPGNFNVTLTVRDEYGASSTDNILITVESPILGHIHVQSITISGAKSGKNQYKALATVKIVNQDGSPMSGVSVSGVFSGVVSGTASGVTDAAGVAIITSSNTRTTGIATFSVNQLTVTSYKYDSSANVMTSGSGDITPTDSGGGSTKPGKGGRK